MDVTELHDKVNFEHSRKVATISRILAEQMGYDADESSIIEQAALYHDLGKDEIPKSILNKPGALTAAEFEIIKKHTSAGHKQLADAAEILRFAAIAAQEHHEKIDGSGYIGLSGNDIHPIARLISVADVFDALLSQRVYKPAWNIGSVMDYMNEQSDKQFDRKIVRALLSSLETISAIYGL